MKTDNTISMVSRLHEFADQYIVLQLRQRGVEDIAPSQGSILASLIQNKEMSLGEIATNVRRDRSTITTAVRKLEHLGYVNRKTNKEDKRSALVHLSKKGKSLAPVFMEISEQLFRQSYRGFRKEDREQFRTLLQRMLHNLTP